MIDFMPGFDPSDFGFTEVWGYKRKWHEADRHVGMGHYHCTVYGRGVDGNQYRFSWDEDSAGNITGGHTVDQINKTIENWQD